MPATTTQAEADAAEVRILHRQLREIEADDHSGKANQDNAAKLRRLMRRLTVIRDRQHGLNQETA